MGSLGLIWHAIWIFFSMYYSIDGASYNKYLLSVDLCFVEGGKLVQDKIEYRNKASRSHVEL
jgi:hypothetical protein